jgi:Fe-S-cluster-containing hydrogenase component 2
MEKSKRIEVHPENCVGCLTCQLACSFTYTDRFNPLDARIIINWSPEGSKISFADPCTECGVCADYCFYGTLKKVEEEG